MGDEQEQKLFEMLFLQMVMSLNEAAMIQLGKMANPGTGKTEMNLSQAKGTIDLLRMLKTRTTGNLNDQENQLLDQSILNLEMTFVHVQKAGQQAKPPKEQDKPKAKEVEISQEEDSTEDDNLDSNDSLGNRPGMNN